MRVYKGDSENLEKSRRNNQKPKSYEPNNHHQDLEIEGKNRDNPLKIQGVEQTPPHWFLVGAAKLQ